MIIVYVFGTIVFAMLAIVCVGLVVEVRRGNYTKGFLGAEKLETRHPLVAVCPVLAPFPVIFITAISQGDLSGWGAIAFATLGGILALFVWRAASKLWRRRISNGS